jgi:hypothetical protein
MCDRFAILAEDDLVRVPDSDLWEVWGVGNGKLEGGLLPDPGFLVDPLPIEPDLMTDRASCLLAVEPENEVALSSIWPAAAPGGRLCSYGKGSDMVDSIDLRPDNLRTACAAKPPDSEPVGVVGESYGISALPAGDWSIEDKGLGSVSTALGGSAFDTHAMVFLTDVIVYPLLANDESLFILLWLGA